MTGSSLHTYFPLTACKWGKYRTAAALIGYIENRLMIGFSSNPTEASFRFLELALKLVALSIILS